MRKLLFLFAIVAFLGTTYNVSANVITKRSTITIVDNDNDDDKDNHCCKHKTKAECEKDSANCCKDKNCECQADCDKDAKKAGDSKNKKSCCDKKAGKSHSCPGHHGESCNHHPKLPKK